MSSFTFDTIKTGVPMDISNGNYLWIWYANKIPPHIGVSIQGNYFSLKVNGKDVELPVDKPLMVIERKTIATIWVELTSELKLKHCKEIFSNYSTAQLQGATCLSPLKDLLEDQDSTQLSEFLNNISCKYDLKYNGIHLPSDYKELPLYSQQEIQNRLEFLENAQRKEHIS